MDQKIVLHSGPDCTFEELSSIHRKGVVGAALHEKWAVSREDAEDKFRRNEIKLGACNDHATVGAGAGILSPSMPVLICRDMHNGNEGYCLPFEGRSGLGVWGVYNDDVEATLQVIEKQFAPAVNQVLTEQGGIPVKGIIARSLQMNDDIHTRQTAAGLILLSEIAPKLMHSDLDREAITMCIEMFSSSERWFHPLGMASAMSTIRGLKGTEYSTVVTAICNGGVNTGLKVAALGEQWFTAPAPMLTGSYLSPQWSEKDASPYCGDSTITEVVGMGAFAGAAAPSVLRLRGGTYQDGINQSMDMRTLTVGLNSNYPIPLLDFTGPGLAIDIRKVINTGTPVVCHGGIISKDGGQIGAGIPLERKIYAVPYEWYEKYGFQRMGYHGASHSYVSETIELKFGSTDKMISCHLGGSCSLCAIDEGKSVDTTFGLSLQNGICHANRCGDLDVYVFPFLNNRGYSNAEILQGLEKEGGLLGISGVSNDMRELREAAASGNERAQLAINHFVNGIVKYIGAFYAELGGLDNLVFTGGIGENDDALRTAVCQQLAHLGVELADNSEVDADGTRVISAANSRVRVVVIPANEELGVARKTYQAIS